MGTAILKGLSRSLHVESSKLAGHRQAADAHGITADRTVLDIILVCSAEVKFQLNTFPAGRAGNRSFLEKGIQN